MDLDNALELKVHLLLGQCAVRTRVLTKVLHELISCVSARIVAKILDWLPRGFCFGKTRPPDQEVDLGSAFVSCLLPTQDCLHVALLEIVLRLVQDFEVLCILVFNVGVAVLVLLLLLLLMGIRVGEDLLSLPFFLEAQSSFLPHLRAALGRAFKV